MVRREPRSKLNQLWQLGDTATSTARLAYTLPGYSEAPTGLGGLLLISLAFKLACSWEMSAAQEQRSTKNKVLSFAASQFTLCEQL